MFLKYICISAQAVQIHSSISSPASQNLKPAENSCSRKTAVYTIFGTNGSCFSFFTGDCMILCDAHLHASQCRPFEIAALCCSCAHSPREFLEQERIASEHPGSIVCAFGLHPQEPAMENAAFLESLLREKRISAVGEAGFDFFTAHLRQTEKEQREAFQTCLELALAYQVPLVIHDRKALDSLFPYAFQLKKLPAVIFHSFAFGPQEARSLLRKGINCFFSFGSPLLAGSRKAAACVRELPLDMLLLETDAPYQSLRRGQPSSPSLIAAVYEKAAQIRGSRPEEISSGLHSSFLRAFKKIADNSDCHN